MKSPDEGIGRALRRLRSASGSAWRLYLGAAKEIWKDLAPLFSAPRDGELPSERLDEFMRRNSYRLAAVFVSSGAGLLVLALALSFVFPNSDLLRGTYYILIFVGGGLAAAVATWRGRQFERQLREARFEKAIDMLMEKNNDTRIIAGARILFSLRGVDPYMATVINSIAVDALTIKVSDFERYKEIHSKFLRNQGGSALQEALELTKNLSQGARQALAELVWIFPPSRDIPPYEVYDLSDSEAKALKKKVLFPSSQRAPGDRFLFSANNNVAHVNMWNVEYLCEASEGSLVNQVRCLYYCNEIHESEMRKVDFYESMLLLVEFFNTTLDGSKFERAVLYDTIFGKGTSLRNASFSNASLWGCKFDGADITGCDFEDAEGITTCYFEGAYWTAPEGHPLADDLWEDDYAPKFPRDWEREMQEWGKLTRLRDFVEGMRRDVPPAGKRPEEEGRGEGSGGEKGGGPASS